MNPNSIIPLFSTPLYHTHTDYVMDTKEFERLKEVEWFYPPSEDFDEHRKKYLSYLIHKSFSKTMTLKS